ncbi:MAG: acylphosphatase [Archaeoglobaceae archaeon]
MRTRYYVLIEGEVQKGGLRSFIKKHALMHGITGYAENLEGGEVIVVFEGEKENVIKLLEIVEKESPTYIKVENMAIREEKYTGSFNDFERKGTDILPELEEESTREILHSMASTLNSTDKKLEIGVERLEEISNKQDETINILKLVKEDTSAIKEDTSAIKEDTSAIKEDTSAIKKDTSAIKEDTSAIKKDTALLPSIKDDTLGIKKNTESVPDTFSKVLDDLDRIKKALNEAGIDA